VIAAWREDSIAGLPFTVEYRVRRKDGVYRDFSVRGVPVLNRFGEVREWVGTCTDITERNLILSRLREQTEVVEAVNHIGQLLSAELDLQRLAQAVIDTTTALTGARFGIFFFELTNEDGERAFHLV